MIRNDVDLLYQGLEAQLTWIQCKNSHALSGHQYFSTRQRLGRSEESSPFNLHEPCE